MKARPHLSSEDLSTL